MSSKSLGILYGVLGVVLFSSKAVMVKLAYRYDVDTLDLLLFRMLFSLPFYILILFLIRKKSTKAYHGNHLSSEERNLLANSSEHKPQRLPSDLQVAISFADFLSER